MYVLYSGSIREGDQVMLGPGEDGTYRKIKVKSVHRNRLPCRLIQAGQAACVSLQDVGRETVRKVCRSCNVTVKNTVLP